ncbi:MAG: cytochrome c biogenesis protein DipZ [Rickettsiales bacterium]
MIGLVWTPCAGPILAAVLVQVIRQENDVSGFLIIAAFAIGAGVPMLVIALTGRKLMSKLGFFTQHAEQVRKAFGIIILLAVAYIASGANPQSDAPAENIAETSGTAGGLQAALTNPYDAPEFTGIDTWLNSDPLTMKSLRGKVVLIDFWTYSCINCIRTLPYITKWDEKYRDNGLVIVGVHAPEFEFEKNQANVEAAIKKYNIKYPVAMDNNLDTWTAFKNRYWPAHYLINQEGKVVYTHFGEGQYARTENNIRTLLGITEKTESTPEQTPYRKGQTPETYLGYARAQSYAGSPALIRNQDSDYQSPASLPLNNWALGGGWNVAAEKITSTKAGATLKLHFKARRVFLVMGTANGEPVEVTLTLNGHPVSGTLLGDDAKNGTITVDSHRLYSLIDQPEFKSAVLEITADGPGLEAYAFTFGD